MHKKLNSKTKLSENIAILTDCKPLLQSLERGDTNIIMREITNEIEHLQNKSQIHMQWIHSHCGITGNKQADKQSK